MTLAQMFSYKKLIVATAASVAAALYLWRCIQEDRAADVSDLPPPALIGPLLRMLVVVFSVVYVVTFLVDNVLPRRMVESSPFASTPGQRGGTALLGAAMRHGPIIWDKYPDKSSRLTAPSNLTPDTHVFLVVIPTPETLGEVLMMTSYLVEKAGLVTVVIPFMPFATDEKAPTPGHVPTGLHSYQVFRMNGEKVRLIVGEPHTNHGLDSVGNRMNLMDHLMNFAAGHLFHKKDRNLIVVFPDEGSRDRYSYCVPSNASTVCMSKVRSSPDEIHHTGEFRVVPNGRPIHTVDFLIVDDIARTCSTLLSAIKELRTFFNIGESSSKFTLAVTHSVFAEEQHMDRLLTSREVHAYYTTDSNPDRVKALLARRAVLQDENPVEVHVWSCSNKIREEIELSIYNT
ncbi:hypothetical protein CEUSTIGMA_g11926.t1 [Chlamydomonas eustigma]|uniref:Phosphoribosyltransferase domain-containing protein n=1 Tax=Chlamydomonas eustigma TaxID=1157962 RepID=A0A250XNB4_9CHLO|nr:hypothetical protein CEUSTIGMA_g11926.t1 [Chlamydomonas eustigma]|eukprot:GAX84506.1 hypothetical protein CEUSTIGMA_g11926.t1 [Chlamydomonas eustigma]